MGMPVDRTRYLLRTATGAALLVAAGLLPAGKAQSQTQPGELLRQVLPGILGQQDPRALQDAGERACERYAEDRGLDVRRVLEARRSGEEDIEVTLDVEDRDDRYDAVCLYDGRDQEVREFESARGGDGEVDERLAERARDACQDAAEDRDFDEVDVDEVRERDRDTVEVMLQARDRDGRREVTCLYDDEERRAFLAAE